MSTGNRLARAVDRARQLSREIEDPVAVPASVAARRAKELDVAEARSLLLLRAMRDGYVALTGFASAALASLLGATVVSVHPTATGILEGMAILAGAIAVAALISASVLLVRETRLAVSVLQERAAAAQLRARGGAGA